MVLGTKSDYQKLKEKYYQLLYDKRTEEDLRKVIQDKDNTIKRLNAIITRLRKDNIELSYLLKEKMKNE